MPTLNDKDQKRLSGFGLPSKVENAVSEIWSTRYGGGNLGFHVSLALMASAVALVACDSVPSLSPSVPLFVWMSFILSATFSLLGMVFIRLGSERRRLEEDTERNRKLFLSKTFLNHVFAKGIRKRLGSIAAGSFAFALISAGQWPFAVAFVLSTLALSVGIGMLEYRTTGFLKMLEERLYADVRSTRTSDGYDFDRSDIPNRRRFIERMKRPGVEIVDADFVEVPRK